MILPFYWLYLWQLKEYRIDRMLAYLKSLPILSLIKELLWGKLRWPKPTIKSFIVLLFIQLIDFLYLLIIFTSTEFGLTWLWGTILLWFLQPLITSASVLILQTPTFFIKQFLIFLARRKIRSLPHLTVIGITGSFGKTSTKEFLTTILSEKFKVLKTPRSVNTDLGIALTMLENLQTDHQIFVVEMGAYKRGEIKKICQMVKPKIGIITGLNNQHLALFGNFENILKAKYELIESLPPEGLAILNADNKHCLKLAQKILIPTKCYSINSKSDLWAENITQTPNNLEFATRRVADSRIEKQKIQVHLLGKQNISNLLAAITTALHLGMSLGQIAQAAKKISAPNGTMKLLFGVNQTTLIDDTFSSNADGFLAALKVLKEYPVPTKMIVTPGIIELGQNAGTVHTQIGEKIASVSNLTVVTSSLPFLNLKKGYTSAKGRKGGLILEENPREVIKLLKPKLNPKVTVLLEGRIPEIIKRNLTRVSN